MKRTQSFTAPTTKRRRKVQRAKSVVRYAQPRGEKKFLDTDIGTAFGTLTANMEKSNLNIIPQGDGESERVGRRVTITDIHIQGSLVLAPPTAASNGSDAVKLMLVVDKQTNKATFGTTVLLEADAIYSYRKLPNATRFQVLWSKTFELNSGGGAASGAAYVFSENRVTFNKTIRCNIPVEFNDDAATGAIETQTVNSLHMTTQCATGAIVALEGNARIRYYD